MNTRLEIASRILAAWFTEDSHEDYNEAAVCKSALCWADALIAAELATRPEPPHVHAFPPRWEWDGKPGRNIKRYCKCGQVEFAAIGEP